MKPKEPRKNRRNRRNDVSDKALATISRNELDRIIANDYQPAQRRREARRELRRRRKQRDR